MPEFYEEAIPARNLVKKDELDTERGVVTSVSVKQKYTFVTTDRLEKQLRLRNDEIVVITRERMTPDELAAHTRETELHRIDWEEQHAEDRYVEACDAMRKYMDNEYLGNHGPYDQLMIAEARWDLWRTLQYNHRSMNQIIARDGSHTLRRYGAENRVLTEYTRFDAVVTMARYIWREITMHGSRLHRSTSIISNAVSDARMDARIEFMRDMESIIEGGYSDL